MTQEVGLYRPDKAGRSIAKGAPKRTNATGKPIHCGKQKGFPHCALGC